MECKLNQYYNKMNFATKLLLVSTSALIKSVFAEESCSNSDPFRMDLFHSGFYVDSKCPQAEIRPISSRSQKNEHHFLKMLDQLNEQYGELNKAWPHQYREGYNGLVATQDIEAGELVAFIPRSMMLTYREAQRESVVIRKISKEFLTQTFQYRSDLLKIAAFIMQEKRNPLSDRYDWFQTLEFDRSTQLINIGFSDLEWFTGSQARQTALQLRGGLMKEYEAFDSVYEGFKDKYSKQEFFDAWVDLKTKGYDAPIIEQGYEQRVLVPFLDQINMSGRNNVEWTYEKRNGINGFAIRATQAIQRGQELLGKYPEQHNRDLMMNLGFVDSQNESHLPMMFGLSVPDTDPLIQFKQFWFKDGDPQYGGIVITPIAQFDSDLFKDTLAILRVLMFDDSSNIMYLKDANISWDKPRKNNFKPYNLRIEAMVMKKLQNLCLDRLKTYPRTIQGDQELLEKGKFMGDELSETAKSALKLTIDEKMTLHKLAEASEKVQELPQNPKTPTLSLMNYLNDLFRI